MKKHLQFVILLLSMVMACPLYGQSPAIPMELYIESTNTAPGVDIVIPIKVKDCVGLAGFQGTLQWTNNSTLAYQDIALNPALGGFFLSPGGPGVGPIGPNQVTFTAFNFSTQPVSLNDDDPLFFVTFNVIGPVGTSAIVEILSPPTLTSLLYSYKATPMATAVSIALPDTAATIIIGAGFPVTWLGLDARTTDEGVAVSWATATELNNDYFEVERVLPNGETAIIGRMDAAGTADSERNYSMMDPTAPQGQLKYRIKQVDFDGGYSYSSFVEVVNVQEESLVYPNPTNGALFIAVPEADKGRVEVTVRDLTGRTVLTTVSEGAAVIEISIADQPAGWYVAETVSGAGIRSETRILKSN